MDTGAETHITSNSGNLCTSQLPSFSTPSNIVVGDGSLLPVTHTATYLLNRQPTKTLTSATPFFALFRTQPSYDHLRVFGCRCYPNLSSTTAHKLAPRSAACVFLGYPSECKGYRYLDLSTNRLIISRHVIFYETSFPFSEVSSPPSSDFDFLSGFDDAPIIPIGVSHVSGTLAPCTAAPVGPSPQVAASGAMTFSVLASTRAACISSDVAASEPLVLPLRLPRPPWTRLPPQSLVRLAPPELHLVVRPSTARHHLSSNRRLPMMLLFSLQQMNTA
jgi:hypothetical protein